MVVKGVFTKGRPTNSAANTTSVMRYLPTPRSPVTPFKFRRENVDPADLKTFWNKGRYGYGPEDRYSGYNSNNKLKVETDEVPMIPRKQLEKFMPNIDIGSKSFVTPTSMMSARSGHRVTHDLLHSYDKYIGGMGNKLAEVDHDNISIHDPNRVGLHPDTISCRAKMFRWFRRGPFFQENHYFIRSALRELGSSSNPFVARVENPLHTKIIRLSSEGHLKSACEEYRRLSFIPPVEVFRALTAACVPDGKLADAIAIFKDGNHRLRHVGRDFEVFRNVMMTAINADNADRVMWLVNETEGTFTENVIVRAKFTALERFDLYQRALEFLLDKPGCDARAKELYNLMSTHNLLNCDLFIGEGAKMREEIAKKVADDIMSGAPLMVPDTENTSAAIQQASKDALEIVAKRMFRNKSVREILGTSSTTSSSLGQRLAQIVSSDGVDIYYIMRLCRFLESEGSSDLLAEKRLDEFAERAEEWILQLSPSCRYFAAAADQQQMNNNNNSQIDSSKERQLPYLPKSRSTNISKDSTNRIGTSTNEFIRIAVDPLTVRRNSNNEISNSVSFHYQGPSQRFVEETYPSLDVDSAASKYLARQPVHKEKFVELFASSNSDEKTNNEHHEDDYSTPLVIHSSISSDASRLMVSSSHQNNRGSSSSSSGSSNSMNKQQNSNNSRNKSDQKATVSDPSMEGHF